MFVAEVAVLAVVAVVAVAAFPVTLPLMALVTVKLAKVPTLVKLELSTLEASVAPVNVPAAAAPPPDGAAHAGTPLARVNT